VRSCILAGIIRLSSRGTMSLVRSTQSTAVGSVVVFVGIALLLLFAKELVILVAFALILALLLLPAVSWLQRKGMSSGYCLHFVGKRQSSLRPLAHDARSIFRNISGSASVDGARITSLKASTLPGFSGPM
jgi:Na+/serine symporter